MKLNRTAVITNAKGEQITPKMARNILQRVAKEAIETAYKAGEAEALISFTAKVGNSDDITLADILEIAGK